MKNIMLFVLVFCLAAFSARPASAWASKSHEEYMENESYKNAFEQFTAGMEEAKERLAPGEYKALEKTNEEAISASVEEDMANGSSEAEAYETAYWVRYEQTSTELRWDWLRKNAEDAQGFYRLKSDSFDGYLTLEKGDEDGLYAVEIEVVMKSGSQNSGHFSGPGILSGGPRDARTSKMTVSDGDAPDVITIAFDGETAKLTSSKAFKESGVLGAGVTFDGEYEREKR